MAGLISAVAFCPNIPATNLRDLPKPKGRRDKSIKITLIVPSSSTCRLALSFGDTEDGSVFAVISTDALWMSGRMMPHVL